MELGAMHGIDAYNSYAYKNNKTTGVAEEADFKSQLKQESEYFPGDMIVPQPPSYAYFQYNQSISDKSKEEMTLDEYKQWFMNEMSKMPVSGCYTSHFHGYLIIKEEAFERMKNDQGYEKKIMGMLREMYSCNGFAYGENFMIQIIGETSEECYGYSEPIDDRRKSAKEDDESWWEKRQKKMKETMEEAIEKAYREMVKRRKEEMAKQLQKAWEEQAGYINLNTSLLSITGYDWLKR